MRRLEAGPSGWLAPTTAPRPGASFSPDGETRGDAVAASRVPNAHPTARRPKSGSSRVPGRHSLREGRRGFHERDLMAPCIGLLVSCPSKRWAKIVTPPGWPWSKPTKHRARNAEVSAESRSTTKLRFRIARSWSTRVRFALADMRPGVPRALQGANGEMGRGRIPRRPKNRECGALATRAV